MTQRLTGSVGENAQNAPADVMLVQTCLSRRNVYQGQANGICDSRTIDAIRTFQASFMTRPDGRVDANGNTWHRLRDTGHAAPASPGGGLTRLLPKPAPGTFNAGLTAVSNRVMMQMFGAPRDDYSQDCQPLTNATLRRNVVHETVGPIRVQGLGPAVASLQQVFAEIARSQPTVHGRIGTAGMLCCRYQRNSTTSISNHSWGTAVDLKIDGHLDERGDDTVQYGLTLIAPIFNRFGWYWGAMFPTEDAMHFEASLSLAQTIQSQLV